MTDRRCLAVAQTCAVPGDVAANLDQHIRLARLAIAGGAEVVVFPELSLTGYELEQADALAFQRIDDRLEPLLGLARQAGATIIAGAPVRLGGALHIGAAVMDADGGLEWYTKRHLGAFGPATADDAVAGRLPPDERTIFAPGTHDPSVRLVRGTARLAICADTSHPEHAAAAAAKGVGAYLVGSFIVPSSWEAEAAVLYQAAVTHGMLLAMANHGAPTGGMDSAGRSGIWDERGELILQLEPSGPGVGIARETQGGDWQPVARMMTLGSMGLEEVGVG